MLQALIFDLDGTLTHTDSLHFSIWQSYIVTNAPRQNAEFMLNALKLNQFWNTVVISEELPMAKPHPFPYQEALRRLNIAPNSAIVFEQNC